MMRKIKCFVERTLRDFARPQTISESLEYIHVSSLERFKQSSIAIVFGPTGMGKTTFMEDLKRKYDLPEKYFLDLSILSSMSLANTISELKQETSTTENEKIIIVDGLDNRNDPNELFDLLHNKAPKTKIWISTRPTQQVLAFINKLEVKLEYIIPKYELEGFKEEEIKEFAKQNECNSEAFYTALKKNNLTDLCSTPIICELMLESFKDKKTFSRDLSSILDQAISKFFTTKPYPTDRFSLDDMKKCSAWIALCLTLTGKHSVSQKETDIPNQSVKASDLQNRTFNIDLIDKTLTTGLFSFQESQFVFTHNLFWNYLTAQGFHEFIATEHWQDIFKLNGSSNFFPQLLDCASWLALYDPQIKKDLEILRPEYLVPFYTKINQHGTNTLAQSLINQSDEVDNWAMTNNDLQSLRTNDTHQFLESIISANNLNDSQIYLVSRIVTSCQYANLSQALMTSILPTLKKMSWRTVLQITDMASAFDQTEFTPMLWEFVEHNDPRDDIRGQLLYWCFPKHMNVDDLIEKLIEPKIDNFSGSYKTFLEYSFYNILPTLKPKACTSMLTWAINQISPNKYEAALARFARSIFTFCWEQAETNEDLIPLLTIGYIKTLVDMDSPFFTHSRQRWENFYTREEETHLVQNTTVRQAVLTQLVAYSISPTTPPELNILDKHFDFPVQHIRKLDDGTIKFEEPESPPNFITTHNILEKAYYGTYPLYCRTDAEYLLGKIETSENNSEKEIWASCFSRIAYDLNLETWGDKIAALHGLFTRIVPSLHEIETRKTNTDSKKREEEQKKQAAKQQQTFQQTENLKNFVALLTKTEKGDFESVFQKIQDTDRISTIDITSTKKWNRLNPKQKATIIDNAKAYLWDASISETDKAYGRTIPHLTSCSAFYLFYKESTLDNIPSAIWQRHAYRLLNGASAETNPHLQPIWDYWAINHPDTITESLSTKTSQSPHFIHYWAKRLTEEQINAVLELDLPQKSYIQIIEKLLEQDQIEYAKRFFDKYCPAADDFPNDDQELIFALELYPSKYENAFLEKIATDIEWGKNFIFTKIFCWSRLRYNHLFSKWTVQNIAAFYIWLYSEILPLPTEYGEGSLWKNDILELITAKGGVIELRKISNKFNNDSRYADYIKTAKQTKLRNEFTLYTINDIEQLSSAVYNRVGTIFELKEAVLRELEAFQQSLQGKEHRSIKNLWDSIDDQHRPRSEEYLSDELKRYLELTFKNTGILVLREVDLQSKYNVVYPPKKNKKDPDKTGSRVDLFIVKTNSENQHLILCIEVKPNWNSEVKTALNEQLIQKYMANRRTGAGIYLFAWYGKTIPTKRNNAWSSLDSSREKLKAQCSEAKQNGHDVSLFCMNCEYE